MSSEIQLYEKIQDPVAGIMKLGESLGRSMMLGFTKSEQGIVLAWECFATRRSPMQVMRRIHITHDGKFLMRSDAMLSEFLERGGSVKWTKHTPTEVEGEWESGKNKMLIGYHIDTAREAGYVKPGGGWTKDPEAQLQAACIRKAIRMLDPGVIVECGDAQDEREENAPPKLDLAKTDTPLTEKVIAETLEKFPAESCKIPTRKIIDVAAENVEVANVGNVDASGHAEAPAPKPDAKPESGSSAPPAATSSVLPLETVQSLEAAIGVENAVSALLWLKSPMQKWLQGDETLENLKPAQAKRILARTEEFLRAVKRDQKSA